VKRKHEEKTETVQFKRVALDPKVMNAMLLGPHQYTYSEIIETRTRVKRHFWLFGEHHRIEPCANSTSIAEWIMRFISTYPDIVLDIFIETAFVDEDNERDKGDHVTHMDAFVRAFEDCFSFSKKGCELSDNARFHYVDVRETGQKNSVNFAALIWYHWADGDSDIAVRRHMKKGLAKVRHGGRAERELELSISDTWLWLVRLMQTRDMNMRIMKQKTHVEQENPNLAICIDFIIRHEMWQQIADSAVADTLVLKRRTITYADALWMDYYTMFRANGRFASSWARFQTVTNAIIWAGSKHTQVYQHVLDRLQQLGHISIVTTLKGRADKKGPCVRVNTAGMGVLIQGEPFDDLKVPVESIWPEPTRVPIVVKGLPGITSSLYFEMKRDRVDTVWVLEAPAMPEELVLRTISSIPRPQVTVVFYIWDDDVLKDRIMHEEAAIVLLNSTIEWGDVLLLADAWERYAATGSDSPKDLNRSCDQVAELNSWRVSNLTAMLHQVVHDRARWISNFVAVYLYHLAQRGVTEPAVASVVQTYFEAEIAAHLAAFNVEREPTLEREDVKQQIAGLRAIVRSFVDYAACTRIFYRWGKNRLRNVVVLTTVGRVAVMRRVLDLLRLQMDFTNVQQPESVTNTDKMTWVQRGSLIYPPPKLS
jgi:hypothetical protein